MKPMEPPIEQGQHSLQWKNLIKLSSRNFSANPGRTILTILGTSVGIATVVILVSLGYGLQGILLGKLITTPESLVTISASYPSNSNLVITQSTVNDVMQAQGVVAVSPVAEFPGSIQVNGISGLALINIVDGNYTALSGDVPDIGTGIGKTPGVVISSQALRLLNMPADSSAIGKRISLTVFYVQTASGTNNNVSTQDAVPILGIERTAASPTVIVSDTAFPGPPPSYSSLYVEAKSDAFLSELRTAIANKGFVISAHIDLVRQAQQVTNIITIILGVFGIAALVVSAIGMFNTMIVGFLERTYEVGVMKALGATDKDVEKLFLMESLIMGLAGGVIGIVLGMGLGLIFNLIVSEISTHYGGASLSLFVSPAWFLILVVGVSALIGLAAGFIPARRASRLSPKEAFLKK
jgi:putative ABC transport system permease protein